MPCNLPRRVTSLERLQLLMLLGRNLTSAYCLTLVPWCCAVQSGDIFQLVLSQRYERRTFADPFEVYRALRVVNPSPYMVYMQARGCIIVSSSPEILCR